jgi:hypothetical protein
MNPVLNKTLLAAATRSAKPRNEDACAVVRNEPAGLNAIIVADGLGSHYGADQAAALAVAAVRQFLLAARPDNFPDPHELIQAAQQELAHYLEVHKTELPDRLHADNAFGTTLLCAIETDGQIHAAYTGNGALLHLRGNFNRFPPSQLVPWSVMNYLNPHSLMNGGRNVLYHIVSPFISPARFTALSISKDEAVFGDILVASTDGLCSFDQAAMGQDVDRGHTWIQVEPRLLILLERLGEFLRGGDYRDEALEQALDAYLDELVEKGLTDDDCTLAVLVTARALDYQRKAATACQTGR